MRKIKLIYNPNSGERRIVSNLDYIIQIYQEHNYIVMPYRMNNNLPLSCAFEEISEYDHILIAGGDGTIDLVLNELKSQDINIPIGILPTGTANDFANALKLQYDIKEAIENIIHARPKKIDIGKINDKYFVNVASAGMFTDVSQKINIDLKNSIGRVSYYIKGIEEALNMRKFNIRVKSSEVSYKGDMYLMLIFNGKTAGNINLGYKAELDDGYLDVVIFKGMPLPKSIPILFNIIKGDYLENYHEEEIIYFKTRKLLIECEDILMTDIDGEKGPDFPLDIECISDGIEILGILN